MKAIPVQNAAWNYCSNSKWKAKSGRLQLSCPPSTTDKCFRIDGLMPACVPGGAQACRPFVCCHISSSSDSSEILSFSMADLMRFESELLGLRSSAVLKCLKASLCCSNFLKILPIWNQTLASFGAISCRPTRKQCQDTKTASSHHMFQG